MVSAPIAGRLGLASTAAVAALVSSSSLPASSVKLTATLTAFPSSSATRVYVESVAPGMSAPSARHW